MCRIFYTIDPLLLVLLYSITENIKISSIFNSHDSNLILSNQYFEIYFQYIFEKSQFFEKS